MEIDNPQSDARNGIWYIRGHCSKSRNIRSDDAIRRKHYLYFLHLFEVVQVKCLNDCRNTSSYKETTYMMIDGLVGPYDYYEEEDLNDCYR